MDALLQLQGFHELTVEGDQLTNNLINALRGPLVLTGNGLAGHIVSYMLEHDYVVALSTPKQRRLNIVYVEGMNLDGTLNDDAFNEWNDVRALIEIVGGTPRIVDSWVATTEPGDYYTEHPLDPEGAFRIAFGQYRAWQVGIHGNSEPHEALVQAAPIRGYRDSNEDGLRTGDPLVEGDFGVNQHWGYDMEKVGRASAGCLVGQSREGHRRFMGLLKTDCRYEANSGYLFYTTVIAGDDLIRN